MSSTRVLAEPQPPTINDQPTALRVYVDTFYRTYKGKRLGPYHVRKWKVGRKVKREYIKASDLERVRAACAANREKKKQRASAGKEINMYIDNHSYLWRMLMRLEQGKPIRQVDADHIAKIHCEGCSALGRPKLRRHARIDYLQYSIEEIVARLERRLKLAKMTLPEFIEFFMGASSANSKSGVPPLREGSRAGEQAVQISDSGPGLETRTDFMGAPSAKSPPIPQRDPPGAGPPLIPPY